MTNTFDYKTVPISQVGIDLVPMHEATPEQRQIPQGGAYLYGGGKMIKSVIIDGEPLKPTSRFWTSLYSRFHINKSFFKYFDHAEIFNRISEIESNAMIRICIERSPGGNSRLLAASGTNKPVIVYDDLMEVLHQYRLEGNVGYNNGVITTTHIPRIGASEFQIGGDKFSNRFVLHAPIDGYGPPNFYVSLLRWVCSNGMVGWAKAFRTTLQLGSGDDNIRYTLQRALDGFNNDSGFAQMRDRFETAQKSWASLREQQDLYKILIRLQNDAQLRSGTGFEDISGGMLAGVKKEDWMKGHGTAVLKAFTGMTGDPYEIYYKDPTAMSPKRQRALPVSCRIFDMLNFATEVATHHVGEYGSRTLQAWVGEMISTDYDLEDSCDHFDDFKDFFIGRTEAKETIREQQLKDNYQ